VTAKTALTRWLPLAALVGVLAVALWIGTTRSSGHPSIDDRVQSVTSGLRCPVCTGETVADSSAPISGDIRTMVRQLLTQGESNSQAKSFILSKYPGTSLDTPASGMGLLVWALPVIVVLGAAAGLSLTFARRRSRAVVTVSDEDRALVDEARHHGDH
jgi:cytochrome c-type biogenesis protein CcmH